LDDMATHAPDHRLLPRSGGGYGFNYIAQGVAGKNMREAREKARQTGSRFVYFREVRLFDFAAALGERNGCQAGKIDGRRAVTIIHNQIRQLSSRSCNWYDLRLPEFPVAGQEWNPVYDAGCTDQFVRRITPEIKLRGSP